MHPQIPAGHGPRHRPTPFLPHDALGWWALGLVLAAAANPLYCWALWAATRFVDDPEATVRVALTVAVAGPALVVGSAALVRPGSRSVALVVIGALLALEIAFVVMFIASFGTGRHALVVAAGAVLGVVAGVLLGALRSPRPRS